MLTSVVELAPVVVEEVLVPFPVLLLADVELLVVARLEFEGELLALEVVLPTGSVLDPLGPPEFVEHDATSVGTTRRKAAEKNGDK